MRTRQHDWYNTLTNEVFYGIQVYHDKQWKNYAEDGKPFLVKNQEEREYKRKELRKMKIN